MGAMAIAERKRHEEEAAGLRELVDELSRDVKSGQTRWHRTETKVREPFRYQETRLHCVSENGKMAILRGALGSVHNNRF